MSKGSENNTNGLNGAGGSYINESVHGNNGQVVLNRNNSFAVSGTPTDNISTFFNQCLYVGNYVRFLSIS